MNNLFLNLPEEDTEIYIPSDEYNSLLNDISEIQNQTLIKGVALDLDQTVGDFGRFSIAWKIWKHFSKSNPLIKDCIDEYFNLGGFRPGLKDLIQTIAELKNNNKLDTIAIFTSNSNTQGYVDFIKDVICEYCDVPFSTIDQIITREDATRLTSDGATQKDLTLMTRKFNSYNTAGIKIIDDKDYNIKQGSQYCICVEPYYKDVPIINLLRKAEWWDINTENFIYSQENINNNVHRIPDALFYSRDQKISNTSLAINAIFTDLLNYPLNLNNKESKSDNVFIRISNFLKNHIYT